MVLTRVDPNAPHNLLKRGLIAFGRTPVGRAYSMELASRADPFLLRHSGGRLRLAFTMPTALLRTTGAKTGAVRVYEGYADYKVRTDAIGRRIPILRLTPTSR